MWKRDQAATSSSTQHDPSTEPARPDNRPKETLVMDLGKSVFIKGELSGSEDLTLTGQMEGSIKLPGHTLTIGSHADIKAEISANFVVIMGAVTGNVTAGERVEIQATGSIIGDVVSPRLVIVDGGLLRGKVQMPQRERAKTP
jgi:cytoskeletal protein CcmA (bactofilin family)